MDALRRAEVNDSPAPTDTVTAETEAVASAVPATESTRENLQLEPIDRMSSADNITTPEHPVANDITVNEPEPEITGPVPTQKNAQRAVNSMTGRQTLAKKQTLYILTGMATAGFILAAYYYWQNNQSITPLVAPSATLVTTPKISVVETVAEKITTLVVAAEAPSTTSNHNSTASLIPVTENRTPVSSSTGDAPAALAALATPDQPVYKIEIHKRRAPRAVPTQLRQAYNAYQRKDYQQAEQLYRKVIRRYPANLDAMLGLAAIALHQGDRRVARYYYAKVLKTNPADKTALLALQSLNGEQHQLKHGSQIKHWLQSDNDSAPLHFALGNQHAANARWKEAQQAYFEAYRLASDNPDFAFNLAISLDQLGLKNDALQYYRVAKTLAAGRTAQFNNSQLDRRINQLTGQTETKP